MRVKRTVAERRVEAHVGEHPAAHVLFFGRHWTEQNARRRVLQPKLLRVRNHI